MNSHSGAHKSFVIIKLSSTECIQIKHSINVKIIIGRDRIQF